MKFLITGTKGLAQALATKLSTEHSVTAVSRSSGHDINTVSNWCLDFCDYDVCINCAYDKWAQSEVLENFYNIWKHQHNKQIINIGSSIVDYARSERAQEADYLAYRVHKIALQKTFEKLVKQAQCDIKLINLGLFDSNMVAHLDSSHKMSLDYVSDKIISILQDRSFKRVDLWS
jgi:hypothetical protein